MDATTLAKLTDAQLAVLRRCANGLPFADQLDAELAARQAARNATAEDDDAKARSFAHTLALEILQGGAQGETTWKGIDMFIDLGTPHEQLVARYTVERLEELDFLPAIATAGRMFLKGLVGYEINPAAAFQLFTQGARMGDPLAIYWLGHCLEHGLGCTANPRNALSWYECLPDTPHMELKVARARHYQRGFGSTARRADLPSLHRSIIAYYNECVGPNRTENLITRPSAAEAIEAYVNEFAPAAL